MACSRSCLSPSMVAWVSMIGSSFLVVVAGAADVGVRRMRGKSGCLAGQRLAVQAVPQDRLDAAVGAGAQCQGAGAGGLGPVLAVPAGQPDDAKRACSYRS